MPDLKLIEAFVFVMRHGSMCTAEMQSGVPKATLSRLISRLEESLGAQLFLRGARKTVPTEAGRQFYVYALRMLENVNSEFEEAKAVVQNLVDGISGELRIATASYLSTSYVTHILSRYLQRHPAVVCHLDIVNDPIATAADNVDCYVCATSPSDPNLTTRLLGNLRCRLYASPGYLQKHGVPRTPPDLIRHKGLVLRRHLADVTFRLSSNGETVECGLPVTGSTNDYWIMKTMAIDGYGIAILPEFFGRPEVETGMLLPVLSKWEAPAIPIYCAYQKQRHIGRKLSELIDLMIESFEQIDTMRSFEQVDTLRFYVADGIAMDRLATL